jgi:hypothetical protein
VQDPCRVTNPAGVHRHVDNRLLQRRGLPRVAIGQEKGTSGPRGLVAAIPLLALPRLAMADHLRAVAVGTMENMKNHDAIRAR